MEENPKPRRRWFRFSLRTMLVLVMLVCITAAMGRWMWNRSQHFEKQALLHKVHLRRVESTVHYWPKNSGFDWANAQIRSTYHRMMIERYDRAARYPWLTVSDPMVPQS